MQGCKHFSLKMMYQVRPDDLVPQDNFYRRINFRNTILYINFFPDQKRKLKLVSRIQKQINKFELTNVDLGFVSN